MSSKKLTPIHYKILIKIFELDGFVVKRKKGDHIIMTKPGAKRPLVIKTSPGLVPVTHIRTNMTTAGMSRLQKVETRKSQLAGTGERLMISNSYNRHNARSPVPARKKFTFCRRLKTNNLYF